MITALTDLYPIHDTADRIARYYAARVSFATHDDCYQEAWMALLDAAPHYDPDRGPFAPWAAKVAARRVRAHLHTLRAPVSGPRSRAAETLGNATSVAAEVLAEVLVDDAPRPDDALAREAAAYAVRGAVAAATCAIGPKRRAASRAVLLQGLRPREAAWLHDLDPQTVSRAVRRARADVKHQHAAALRPHL